MPTVNASIAAVAFAGTVVASAGVGYVVSRATMSAQVAVSCPAAEPVAILRHSLPNGPTISITKGQGW